MAHLARRTLPAACVLGCFCACSGGESGPRDAGSGDAPGDGGVPTAPFVVESIVAMTRATDVALSLDATGAAAVAFRADVEGTVPCAETMPPGDAAAAAIRVALEEPAWAVEDVALVGPGVGLDVVWEGADLLLVFQHGASGNRVCAPSDLVSARRSAGYAPQTLVADSGDAPSAVPYSTEGDVVGAHPSAEMSGSDLVVAYGDTHFGYTRDDFERADLEIYRGGAAEVVDAATGAGSANALALGPSGALAIAFANRSGTASLDRFGVWLAIEDGAAWQLDRVMETDPDTSIGVAWVGDVPAVAFFDDREQDLVVATAEAGGFATERVDRRFTTGLYADAASDGSRLVVSFYYCGRDGRADCDPDEDALRWAVREGGTWRVEQVDVGGTDERCGLHTTIALRPDGRARIAYVCHAVGAVGPTGGRVLIAEEK